MALKKYSEDIITTEVDGKTIEVSDDIEEIETEVVIEQSLDDGQILETINKSREEYSQASKKQKKVSIIITVGTVIFMVAALILIICQGYIPGVKNDEGEVVNAWPTWVGFSLVIVGFISTFFIQKFSSKKLNAKAEVYVDTFFNTINGAMFEGEKFKDKNFSPRGHIDASNFIETKLFKDIKNVKSRNIVELTYNDKKLLCADVAASILIKNRPNPLFLGKFYEYENSYDKDCVILFQLKGGDLSHPLDDTEGLDLKVGNNKYLIYSNDSEYKKVLTDRVIGLLKGFKIDKNLIDVVVSIRKGKTVIGIDYDDSFFNLNVDKEYDIEILHRLIKDLERVLSVLDLIK